MLAAALIHPAISLGLAAAAFAWIVWYWRALGRGSVPESRRRIRRGSLLVIAVGVPIAVHGASFLDPARDLDKHRFIVMWSMVLFLIFLLLLTAGIDLFNNMRLHRRQRREEIVDSATKLIRARERARAAAAGAGDSKNGGPGSTSP